MIGHQPPKLLLPKFCAIQYITGKSLKPVLQLLHASLIKINLIFILLTSSDDIQPSTLLSNQSPSGLIL